MGLLKHYLRLELRDAAAQQHPLPGDRPHGGPARATCRTSCARGMERTRERTGLLFNIALNYGGRAEITDAVRRLVADVAATGRVRARSTRRRSSSLPLHGRPARSRPADPHQRRAAHQQLPALADRLRGDLGHRRALARLPAPAPAAGGRGLPEARAEVRRDRARLSRASALMATRAASGRPRPPRPHGGRGPARPAGRLLLGPAAAGRRHRADRAAASASGSSSGSSRRAGSCPTG